MATASPSVKRRRSPRFGPSAKTAPKPIDLLLRKPNTLPVLAAVDSRELLTNSMVQDLLYRDHRPRTDNKNEEAAMKRACDRDIRALIDAELLEAGMVWYEAESGYPYPYRYLQITARGARVLEEADHQVRFKSHRKDKGQDSARHCLGINAFYVALQRACWHIGATLRLFVDDRQIAAMERSDTLLENIPDAFFIIEHEGSFYPAFLEYDRGTETLVSGTGRATDLLTKYSRYASHLNYRFSQAPYFDGLDSPIVLSITEGAAGRMEGMLETAIQAGGNNAYWFATAGSLYASKDPAHFWSDLWRVTGGMSYCSLLTHLK